LCLFAVRRVSTTFSHTPALFTLALHFFSNDTATSEISTLSLHDALPIFCAVGHATASLRASEAALGVEVSEQTKLLRRLNFLGEDRKSTRLNSSHVKISYAVFCLKKKNKIQNGRNALLNSLGHPKDKQ